MKKKIAIKYIVVALITIFIMLLVKGQFVTAVLDDYNIQNAEIHNIKVKDKKIEQILPLQNQPRSINLIMVNEGEQDENIIVELWDVKYQKCYGTETIAVKPSNGNETIITWDIQNIPLTNEKEIMLVLSGEQVSNKIYVSVQDDGSGQTYNYKGKTKDGHIRMNVIYGEKFCWTFFIIFGVVVFVILLGCVYAWEKRITIEKLFVIIALSSGMLIAMINPFGQEPDGWVHMIRAMDVSYGNVLRPFVALPGTEDNVIQPINRDEIEFRIIEPNSGEGTEYLESIKAVKFSKDTEAVFGPYGYSSVFYYPQGLGLFVGRLFGLSVYGCMVLSRWINLWSYVALAYIGIKKMPIYRNLMMVVALLPMTIYQAASVSPDTLINGLSLLFTGLCFYYAFGEIEKLTWKNVTILGMILALLLTYKYIYVILGLLVFMIPKQKFGTKKEYWKAFGIALIPIITIALLYLFKMVSAQINADAVTAVAGAKESVQMTQFDYVKQNPSALVKAIVLTIVSNMSFYMDILNTLGWLNYSLNILQTIIPFVIIVVAVLDTEGVKDKIKIPHKVLCFITAVLVVVMGMVGLYLMDTYANAVGAEMVAGYQTRYAIPVLLPLFMIFSSDKVENKITGFSTKVSLIMGLSLVYTIVTLIRLCY